MAGRKAALTDGWSSQAFRFKLEPDADTAVLLRRHCGMRRKAHNWAVGQMKAEHEMWSRRDAAAMNLHSRANQFRISQPIRLQSQREYSCLNHRQTS